MPFERSSLRIHKGDSKHKLPTFYELCFDEKIQAEVQYRLNRYDHTFRLEAKAKAGVHKVKKFVNLPQEYCTQLGGNKQPIYDELCAFQWLQGYIQCVLQETDSIVKCC